MSSPPSTSKSLSGGQCYCSGLCENCCAGLCGCCSLSFTHQNDIQFWYSERFSIAHTSPLTPLIIHKSLLLEEILGISNASLNLESILNSSCLMLCTDPFCIIYAVLWCHYGGDSNFFPFLSSRWIWLRHSKHLLLNHNARDEAFVWASSKKQKSALTATPALSRKKSLKKLLLFIFTA